MEAIRLETTVEHDGRIEIPGVFAGDEVEVIVLKRSLRAKSYPLRGTPCWFPNPFEPAIPEFDWEQS